MDFITVNEVILPLQMVIHVLILLAFVDTCFIHAPKQKASIGWAKINITVVAVLLMAIGVTICQFFLLGQTEASCQYVHRFAGTFEQLNEPLVRVVFIWRLFEINRQPSRAELWFDRLLLASALAFTVFNVIGYHLTCTITVIQGVCVMIPNMKFTVAFFTLPQFIDLFTNYRLWMVLRDGLQHSKGGTRPFLFLKITFLFCMLASIISLVSALIIIGVIPLELQYFTVYITSIGNFDAWSIALPAIIVRLRRALTSERFSVVLSTIGLKQASIGKNPGNSATTPAGPDSSAKQTNDSRT